MNTVAIVGRPNVGKSTLFNKLIQERKAIVDKKPGITRDRVYGVMEREGKPIILIDTGGLQFHEEELREEVKKQVDFAIEESDVVILLTDGREGLSPLDSEIANYIRKADARKALAINKMDEGRNWKTHSEFSEIVLGKTFQISAKTGRGLDELIEWILSDFEEGVIEKGTTIGVVGKQNTGKSTFVNAVMGYERTITREDPGTTRDSTNSYLEYRGENIILVDTAGLKKRSRLKDSIEYYSFLRAISSIEESDVAIVLIDSAKKLSRQDKRIINWTVERETPAVIGLSKFDLIPKEKEKSVKEYYRKELSHAGWIPKVPVSSFTDRGIDKILTLALNISKRIKEKKEGIEETVKKAVSERPPHKRNARVKIFSVEQDGTKIIITTNQPKSFDRNYRRYLINEIRKNLDFRGIPLRLIVKKEVN